MVFRRVALVSLCFALAMFSAFAQGIAGASVTLADSVSASAVGTPVSLGSESISTTGPFADGERLLREDRPKEAAAKLEKAILEPGVDERAWIYLSVAYLQLGRLDESLAILRKGLSAANRYRPLYFYNMGNVFVLQGKNAFAEEMYGEALALDPAYAAAYLNRANARLNQRNYQMASADYRSYLEIEPASAQRESIEGLLAKLDSALAAEAERIAAEQARIYAEEVAKQALLASIAASLQASAEETMSLSAGSGSVQGYGDELSLDE